MNNPVGKPNFFIVGAPKSGTTSLHYYLSQHPDVLMSSKKEPCFLAPDFNAPSYPQMEEDYLAYFHGYQGQPRVGESTSTYLYSKLAAGRIHEYAPDAKIIALLRNPVFMVPSLHGQRLKEGEENIESLADALEAEEDRKRGNRIPVGYFHPVEYLLYREYGKYAEQLARFFEEFGRDNVHVIIMDDFVESTRLEYDKVCGFLGIPICDSIDFTVKNVGETPRSILLSRLRRRVAPLKNRVVERLKPMFPGRAPRYCWRYLRRIGGRIGRLNLRSASVETDHAVHLDLCHYFKAEIEKLEEFLGLDLDRWRI